MKLKINQELILYCILSFLLGYITCMYYPVNNNAIKTRQIYSPN
jgi:hypothetical protein